MRTVLILLLLANLTLFGYTRLDTFGGGEPARLAEQVDPGKIRILSAQEVAALGPAKVAALNDVCLEWGPLADAERTRALAELAPLNLGSLLALRKVELGDAWAPTLGPFATRALAERRLADVRSRGASDATIVDNGKGGFSIVFGAYRSEPLASARVDALSQQGVAGARAAPRPDKVTQSVIVVRDPPQPVVARIREIQPGYAGTDVRAGPCERTS